jgi:hypothetical protein
LALFLSHVFFPPINVVFEYFLNIYAFKKKFQSGDNMY